MSNNRVNAETRASALNTLRDSLIPGRELDILVIGGGVTGAGIALDAASRGLKTAIVEAQDWASGTSSRSSKLMHGGLRYLQRLDFALVREALAERDLLLTELAPHLVRPAAFLYPLKHRVWDRLFVGAGIALYDVLASARKGPRPLPWHRHLTRGGVAAAFPSLKRSASVGAIRYWDATVDDARFVATLVRTAAGHGAQAAARVQVVGLHQDPTGRVDGATLRDLESGDTFEVRTKNVISATGVWTEATQAMAAPGGLKVLASKGIHLVVPKERIAGDPGLILQTASSVLFVIPWSRYWVIGTTDTPWNEDLTHPVPTSRDIDYVLAEANRVLAEPLTRADIVGTWAGLRPLLQPGTKEGTASAKASREHTVASPVPGLVCIAGGKLTTYRVMARDAVDFALGDAARENPSTTARIRLAGADADLDASAEAAALAGRFGLSPAMAAHLVHRYGTDITRIAEMCDAHADAARPLAGAPAYLRAEIIFAIRGEGAGHLDDLMERRTRIAYEYPSSGAAALEEVARIAQDELGWSDDLLRSEIDAYRAAVEAYGAALAEPDDRSAARVRAQAHDLVPASGM
jgi:glycerol-3-phosphate dehydrogenase